jgi:signal transduction histidine kinase
MLETVLAMVASLVQTPPAAAASAEAEVPAQDPVFQRLAELLSYALGGQRIALWSLEPETGILTLLGAVAHSPDQTTPWGGSPGQRVFAHAWLKARLLEAGLLARLQDGEAVYVELPQPPLRDDAPPYQKTRLLLVPIQRDRTLLGLVTFDPPWTTAQAPAEDLALVQAMARLGALVIERERLLSAQELAQAEALAHREAKRQMEVFLGIAGHELKTPLTSIVLALHALGRRLDRLIHQEATDEERTTALEHMEVYLGHLSLSVGRLERLVQELLDSTGIEAGELALHQEWTDLRAIVSDAVEEQRSHTPDRTIRLQVLPEQPILVCADAQRIGQVVSNYLSNALKYSAEDRPIAVRVEVEGDWARVSVRDEGVGLPVDEQAHVWERFYRVEQVSVQSGSGIGLGIGLYISKSIIEGHHGQVGVHSVPGQGSVFWFTLPLAPAPPPDHVAHLSPSHPGSAQDADGTVTYSDVQKEGQT